MNRYENIFQTLLRIQETNSCVYSEEEMLSLSHHRDILIRSELCYTLLSYRLDFAKDIWLRLITDPNHLVRSSAAECMDLFPGDEDVCDALMTVFRGDKNILVRGYAVYSLLSVGRHNKEVVEFVEKAVSKEHYYFTKLQCYHGLYKFCQKDVLDQIIGCYRAQNHRTRCATVNTLCELVEDGTLSKAEISQILCFIKKNESNDDLDDLKYSFKELKNAIRGIDK